MAILRLANTEHFAGWLAQGKGPVPSRPVAPSLIIPGLSLAAAPSHQIEEATVRQMSLKSLCSKSKEDAW